VVIAALDRVRATKPNESVGQEITPATLLCHVPPAPASEDRLRVGAVVEYHPPGDKRTITCRIEDLEEGRARLEPLAKPDIDWVVLDSPPTVLRSG
jgi:hypothetical protein